MIQFPCSCGFTISVDDGRVGQTTTCTNCRKTQTVPNVSAIQPTAPPVVAPAPPPGGITPETPSQPAPAQQPASYGDYSPRQTAGPTESSGTATVAMVLGIMSFCLPIVMSVIAIIVGFIGLNDTKKGKSGAGRATAGIVLGFASLFIFMIGGILVALLVPAIQRVQQAATRAASANNMKAILIATHHFHDVYGALPAQAICDKDGKPLLSWRVAILPYVEHDALYKKFNLNEPWDSPNNLPLLSRMPAVYAIPGAPETSARGYTHYQVFLGKPGDGHSPIFVEGRHRYRAPGITLNDYSLARITARDGTANTIFLVDATEPVPWTKPADLEYGNNKPLPRLGVNGQPPQLGMADGAVHSPRREIKSQTLRNAITYNDAKAIQFDW